MVHCARNSEVDAHSRHVVVAVVRPVRDGDGRVLAEHLNRFGGAAAVLIYLCNGCSVASLSSITDSDLKIHAETGQVA